MSRDLQMASSSDLDRCEQEMNLGRERALIYDGNGEFPEERAGIILDWRAYHVL